MINCKHCGYPLPEYLVQRVGSSFGDNEVLYGVYRGVCPRCGGGVLFNRVLYRIE